MFMSPFLQRYMSLVVKLLKLPSLKCAEDVPTLIEPVIFALLCAKSAAVTFVTVTAAIADIVGAALIVVLKGQQVSTVVVAPAYASPTCGTN